MNNLEPQTKPDGGASVSTAMLGSMSDSGREEKFAQRLREESANDERCIWMSFCDIDKPKGKQFTGVIITMARGIAHAIDKTWLLKINPGGEVMSYETSPSDIAPEHFDRMLTKDDLVKYGYCDA